MTAYHQAIWNEPLLIELGREGRIAHSPPKQNPQIKERTGPLEDIIPPKIRRLIPPPLPEVSELEVLRHFTRLSQMNYSVTLGAYPLGSCTMKYSPKINDEVASSPKISNLHPYQPEETVQGVLQILYELETWLAEIIGTKKVTLQPAAGAHGEWTGCQIMRAYHKKNGSLDRNEVIIPDTAHGTNPASAAMCGFKTIVVASGEDGCTDLDALAGALSQRTAGLMMTNPNTLGIFEASILEIAKMVHESGGLLYYDGANLNGIMGKARPGDMGFDIVHLNLHKTFSTPHGGGGPGAGPVGASEELVPFLPVPAIEFDGEKYYLDYDRPNTIGKVRGFYGNIGVLIRAAAYILSMGSEGLEESAEQAVLNTNYFLKRMENTRGVELPFGKSRHRKHECSLTLRKLASETGVRAIDVAKRLLDFGIHSPTSYFPLNVEEGMLIELPETEPIEAIDYYVTTLKQIVKEAYETPETVKSAPHSTAVTRLDDIKANHPRTMVLTWAGYRKHPGNPYQ